MQFLEKPWKTERYFTIEMQKHYFVSEPNFQTTKFFIVDLLATETKKNETLLNKPVYLRLSILELSKILIYESWYNYVKPKHG